MSCPEDKKIPESIGIDGNTSLVYNQLEDILKNKEKALENLAYLKSDDFKERFGDYNVNENFQNNKYQINERTNDLREPKLIFNESNNRYYFLDKYNEKVYFPFSNQGIDKHFDSETAYSLAEGIAYDYFKYNLDFNVDIFDIISEDSQNISEFIREYIEDKYTQIDDFLIADSLKDVLTDELALKDLESLFKNVFASIKVDIEKITELEERFENEESTRDDLVRKESYLKNSKDNMTNNIKLMLSLIPSTKQNMFEDTTFVPFYDVYTTLNKEFANLEATRDKELFDVYIEKIKELSNDKPYLNTLLEEHLLVNDSIKEQFTAAFNLSKHNFLQTEIKRSKNDINYSFLNLSSTSTRVNNVIGKWQFNLDTYINKKRIKSKEILAKLKEFTLDYNKNKDSYNLDNLDKLKSILHNLGVTITEDAFNLFLRNNDYTQQELNNDSVLELINGLENFLSKSKGGGKFKSQSVFKKLAKAQAFFMEENSDASIYSMGKNKWLFSNPSYLHKQLNRWKQDPTILDDLYKSSIFTEHSRTMSYMLAYTDQFGNELNLNEKERIEESKKRLNKVELITLNGIQEKSRLEDAVDGKSASKTDLLADNVNKSINIKLGVGNKSYFKTTLAADKSTDYAISWGVDLFFDSKYNYTDKGHSVSSNIINLIFEYLDGEYMRILEAKQKLKQDPENSEINHYNTKNKNAFLIHILPELSPFINKDGSIVLPDTVNPIYDSEGNPLFNKGLQNAPQEVQQELKNIIKQSIADKIDSTVDYFLEQGLYKLNTEGTLSNVGIDSRIFETYKKESGKNVFHKIAADYFLNNLIHQVEYSKMFTGDIAFYKDVPDYIKRVPASYTDGIYMNNLSELEKFFNISVIDSIEIPPYNLKNLPKEVQDLYTGNQNNTTDAQAWITPQRWKFIKEKIGKWMKIDESIYNKMISGKEETYTSKELKRLAQPLKGVHFEYENGRPVYLKYSQAVLVPQLIKDSEILSDLYDKMTKDFDGKTLEYKDQIHELVSIDGVKVGAHKPVNILNTDNSYNSNIQLKSMQLRNSHWKLQQDLNPKGIKETSLGSQLQKLIFVGLKNNFDKNFTDPRDSSKEIKGSELYDMLHDTMSDLSNIQMKNLLKRLGVDSNTFEIQNEDVLYDQIIKDLEARGDTDNKTLDALKSGISPYAIVGQSTIFQNIFSSMINDASVKIKTQGGGHIQMADFGISKTEAKNRGVRFTPWFNNVDGKLHAPEQYTDKNGVKKVRPGGIFISGSMIAKYVPNYRELSDEKLFGTLNENTGKYEGGLIDQRILENIVGYRIPNQGLASSDAFVVMGILPETMADTVVAYNGITRKTGSDYDIDKMYLMTPSFKAKRNYIENEYKKVGIDHKDAEMILEHLGLDYNPNSPLKSFNEYYETIDELKNELDKDEIKVVEKAREALKNNPIKELVYEDDFTTYKGKQNLLIAGFSSVLANPSTIKDVLNPIDIEYIKDDILNLNPDSDMSNFDLFDVNKQLDTKIDFMTGKAGLGQNVNFLVDFVRGLHSNFEILKNSFTNFNTNVNKNGYIGLDKINSKKLTDKEINFYLEDYNSKNPKNKLTRKKLEKELASVKVSDTMTALINAFVDITKDSYIVKGNWNTQTNPIGFSLIRAGVHPFTVNAFLGQPIIKRYSEFRKIKESNLVDDTYSINNKFLIEEIGNLKFSKDDKIQGKTKTFNKRELFKEFAPVYSVNSSFKKNKPLTSDVIVKVLLKNKELKDEFNPTELAELASEFNKVIASLSKKPTNNKFDLVNLRENINNPKFSFSLDVFRNFLDITNDVKEITKSVNTSKNDVNGKGKNITSLFINKNMTLDMLNSKDFLNFKDKFGTTKPTFAYTYYKNSIETTQKIMQNNPKYFITANPSVVRTFNYISNLIYGENLQNEKLGDKLENEYYTYLMSNFQGLYHEGNTQEFLKDTLIKFNEMYEKYPDNYFLKAIEKKGNYETDVYGQNYVSQYFLTINNVKKDKNLKNNINKGFESLYENEKDFAKQMIKYSYLIGGFNSSLNSFHQHIPNRFFNEYGFNSYLKNTLDLIQENEVDSSFIEQFISNNLDSAVITKKLPKNVGKMFNNGVKISIASGINKPVVIKNGKHYLFSKIDNVEGFKYYTKIEPTNIKYESIGINIKDYKFQKKLKSLKYLNQLKQKINLTNQELKFEELEKVVLKDSFENIKIKEGLKVDTTFSWNKLKNQEVFTDQGVNTMRTSNKEIAHAHFGNPFSESGVNNTIKLSSVKDAIQAYKEWLLKDYILYEDNNGVVQEIEEGFKKEQRNWILEQINSGKLDNATLLYDSKLADRGQGTHAHALAEVVQELRNIKPIVNQTQKNNIKNKGEQLDLFNDNDLNNLNNQNC